MTPEIIQVEERMTVERAAQIARAAHHRTRVRLGRTAEGHTLASLCGSVIVDAREKSRVRSG